jgi:protein-S-isoprenylcysteine O-methyltransferase Ste14
MIPAGRCFQPRRGEGVAEMKTILRNADNGMNIVGQGGKIILFTLPAAAAALWIGLMSPAAAALPKALAPLRPAGYAWLLLGAMLWAAGLIQLLMAFPKGKLVTNGAYGACRNPIYASFIVFVLPAVSLLTLTWVWLAVALAMYAGVRLFIGPEERRLLRVFGDEYAGYLKRVSRIMPFVKPASREEPRG